MASFNKVILMGNLTRDVELKYTSSQTAVTEVTLAVNDRRRGQDGQWQDETTFVDVTLWGRTAEVADQYLGKGSGVMIEGRLRLDQWEDKQTGQRRSRLRVTGERMQMLPRGGGGGGGGTPQGGYQDSQSSGGYGSSGPQYGGNSNQGGAAESAPPQQDNGSGFYNDPPASQGMPPADDDIPF
ncbi:MAG: single-stranded DNA-binding protein [Planctomycetaceae bacterium]|nr:single-stranded DNA-binding protein [Planctomycetaceae bacterium]